MGISWKRLCEGLGGRDINTLAAHSLLRGACLLFVKCALFYDGIAQAKSLSVTITKSDVVDGVGGGLVSLDGLSTAKPRTMIVVLGGSEGGYVKPSSPLVAELLVAGHRVAPIAYHGATGTPKHLRDISIDAVAARISGLAELSDTPKGCVGVVGISKGGELTLLLASLAKVGDVHVAMTPSDVVWQASHPSLRRKSSWTHAGKPLAFVKYPRFSRATYKALRDVSQAGDLHRLAMRKAKNLEDARIPIERADQPILLQAGAQDALWPTEMMSNRLLARLNKDKPGHKVELKTYDLGHNLSAAREVRADAVAFLNTQLAKTCPAAAL